jgi:hypothetical protein
MTHAVPAGCYELAAECHLRWESVEEIAVEGTFRRKGFSPMASRAYLPTRVRAAGRSEERSRRYLALCTLSRRAPSLERGLPGVERCAAIDVFTLNRELCGHEQGTLPPCAIAQPRIDCAATGWSHEGSLTTKKTAHRRSGGERVAGQRLANSSDASDSSIQADLSASQTFSPRPASEACLRVHCPLAAEPR